MLIQPIIEHGVTDIDVVDNRSLNVRARYYQRIPEDLWRRFCNEYVGYIIHKGKQHRATEVPTTRRYCFNRIGKSKTYFVVCNFHSRVAKAITFGREGKTFRPSFLLHVHFDTSRYFPIPPTATPTPDTYTDNIAETPKPSKILIKPPTTYFLFYLLI